MGRTPIFRPMPGRVIVKPLPVDDRESGLWLPESHDKSKSMGTIVAIGGDESDGEEWNLAVGDTVIYSRTAGVRINVGRGDEYLAFRTGEILTAIDWEDDNEQEDN